MEGQDCPENPVQLMPMTFGGNANYVSHSSEDASYLNLPITAGKIQDHPVPLFQPPWLSCNPTSHNYVEFLRESEVPKTQWESAASYSNSGAVSEFKPTDLCLDRDAQKVNYQWPQTEGGQANNFTGAEYQIHHKGSYEAHHNASQPQSSIAVAAPRVRSSKAKPRKAVSRQRASASDRQRRLRISEKFDALQELLPHSKEGDRASVLNDTIDHIKNLQLQIQELSQSRLGGESAFDPYIFLQGYGHYISIQEQMLSEPLEEKMGKLLEANPTAAAQLLESRGLYMMPVELAQGLAQSL